jgi:hypothetical protein
MRVAIVPRQVAARPPEIRRAATVSHLPSAGKEERFA